MNPNCCPRLSVCRRVEGLEEKVGVYRPRILKRAISPGIRFERRKGDEIVNGQVARVNRRVIPSLVGVCIRPETAQVFLIARLVDSPGCGCYRVVGIILRERLAANLEREFEALERDVVVSDDGPLGVVVGDAHKDWPVIRETLHLTVGIRDFPLREERTHRVHVSRYPVITHGSRRRRDDGRSGVHLRSHAGKRIYASHHEPERRACQVDGYARMVLERVRDGRTKVALFEKEIRLGHYKSPSVVRVLPPSVSTCARPLSVNT